MAAGSERRVGLTRPSAEVGAGDWRGVYSDPDAITEKHIYADNEDELLRQRRKAQAAKPSEPQ